MKGTQTQEELWSVERALEFYNIPGWGQGYFAINALGHLCVTPYGQPGPMIDIMDVIEDVQEKGLGFPLVVRFQDVLRSRVVKLNETFRAAIQANAYKGQYFGVFPVKVNQMREVVEEILDAGAPYNHGMEAGSKPELVIALGLNTDPRALTICNGYKDEHYMRLALSGRKLGRQVIVVIEKLSELPLILRVANEMGVEPIIGLRAKLTTKGAGKWEKSSGDFAKFGLTIPEIIEAVRILKEAGKESALQLFHFHVGSQLTDIRTVKDAVKEGARIYAKLRKMGMPIQYFDIGGGLGVDYEGTRTATNSSINYSLEEYTSDIVYNLQQICANEEVPEPHLVSESGRAVVAYHSCIIMNVFGSIELGSPRLVAPAAQPDEEHDLVREMREIVEGLNAKNALESYHDAVAKKDEALEAFRLGILGLEDRALIESLFWELNKRLVTITKKMRRVPVDLQNFEETLADQYLANFSLFQSALDHWAFDQLFPVIPLHRLAEQPSREATLVDITCDSDGKIDEFIGPDESNRTVRLHNLRPNEPYFIGMFLTGAYQDIMGDMHNLFGRTNEVHVFVDDEDPEDFYLETVIPGDIISDVIERVQYEPREIVKRVKAVVDQRVKDQLLKPKEGVAMIEFLEATLRGYTYLLPMVADGTEKLTLEAFKQSRPTSAPAGSPPDTKVT
ncbi:MAG TPA: biosynthetic arginine decarboxylase [Candidatus Thermoplasmatota archaeon]|nr:biosynthetic arginine decarboxylase [Candidatus Thermoplasmatota archaeon]